jgi:hypothetical protein
MKKLKATNGSWLLVVTGVAYGVSDSVRPQPRAFSARALMQAKKAIPCLRGWSDNTLWPIATSGSGFTLAAKPGSLKGLSGFLVMGLGGEVASVARIGAQAFKP